MIKKFAFALGVTTICSNIQPASAFQNNEAIEIDKPGISAKRASVKRFSKTEGLREPKKASNSKRMARAEKLAERRKMSRLAKIARAEKIAAAKTAKRIARKNRIEDSQKREEPRNIRIARKKRARFENLLMRTNFKEAVRNLMTSELIGVIR